MYDLTRFDKRWLPKIDYSRKMLILTVYKCFLHVWGSIPIKVSIGGILANESTKQHTNIESKLIIKQP